MQPFLVPFEAEEEREYVTRCAQGDRAARHALIEHNMRLVAHIVKKYASSSVLQEDLMSVGTIGLCKAVDTYCMDKGNRLVTYASRCIENEILMLFRQERKNSRETSLYEPLGTDKDGNEMSLIDLLESQEPSVEDMMNFRDMVARLPDGMKALLSPNEYKLIKLRYGLDGTTPLTQREVGVVFGISRSYVSRMEKKALLKLKKIID